MAWALAWAANLPEGLEVEIHTDSMLMGNFMASSWKASAHRELVALVRNLWAYQAVRRAPSRTERSPRG